MSVNNLDVRTIRFDKFYGCFILVLNDNTWMQWRYILLLLVYSVTTIYMHTIALFPFSNNNADTSFADAFVIYPFFSVCFQSGMLNALIEGSLKSNF